MNIFLKYVIFFLIGIILHYGIYIKEGYQNAINLLLRVNSERDNNGCLNYVCENNDYDYKFYERKNLPQDRDDAYHTCVNIPDNSTFHEIVNEGNTGLQKCSKAICCEDLTCKSKAPDDFNCGQDKEFLPYNLCASDSIEMRDDVEIVISGCTQQSCCKTVNNDSNISNLFNEIKNFRDTHGGNIDNNDKISGLDIRNYIYYNLLKFKDNLDTDATSDTPADYIDFSSEGGYEYLDIYNKEEINYTELDNINKWLSTLDITNQGDLDKVKLNVEINQNGDIDFPEYQLTNFANLGRNVDDMFLNTLNKIDTYIDRDRNISNIDKLKILIIIMDRPVGLYGLKPLDVMLHSYKNENKNILINNNLFHEIL